MNTGRILVISDDPAIKDKVQDGIAKISIESADKIYDVTSISRTDDYVAQAVELMPHMIVIDTSLASTEALTDPVCQALRETMRTGNIPILFLVADDNRPDIYNELQIDYQEEYVQKPFDIEEVKLRVKNTISRLERNNKAKRLP
jgi:DNA-binding response OmpR family regulator